MSIQRNIQYTPCNKNNCDVTAFQEIDVCVPITVEPDVDLGEPIIDCIEEPYLIPITCGSWDKKKRKCKFTICQKLSIMIPIEFYVDACSGPASVNCLGGEEEDDDECPAFICCGKDQRPSFVVSENKEYPPVLSKEERTHYACCEQKERKYELFDFYYYVKDRRGRLKN